MCYVCYVQVLCVETIVSCCVPELPICNVICISQPSTPSSFTHHTLSSSPQHLSRCKSCNLSLRKVPSSSGRDSRVTRGLHHSHHHHPCCSSIVSSSAHWMRCQAGDQLLLMLGVQGAASPCPLHPTLNCSLKFTNFGFVSKGPSNR